MQRRQVCAEDLNFNCAGAILGAVLHAYWRPVVGAPGPGHRYHLTLQKSWRSEVSMLDFMADGGVVC